LLSSDAAENGRAPRAEHQICCQRHVNFNTQHSQAEIAIWPEVAPVSEADRVITEIEATPWCGARKQEVLLSDDLRELAEAFLDA
jgi:hypothetical protein